jgi:hypothetical protein
MFVYRKHREQYPSKAKVITGGGTYFKAIMFNSKRGIINFFFREKVTW